MKQRLLVLTLVTLSILAALPLTAGAQSGRVLEPPLYEFTLPEETPAAADFWNLLLLEDTVPELDRAFAETRPDEGPYLLERTFNPQNQTITFKLCGFTPEVPLEPVITLPDGSLFNDPAALSQLGLWAEAEALPADAPDGTCAALIHQIGIGSYLDGEYSARYIDPEFGEFAYTWTLDGPGMRTIISSPRGLTFDESRQAEWLLMGFRPEDTLKVGVYHRFDTVEPAEDAPEDANPVGYYELRASYEVITDAFGEAVIVATAPPALQDPDNDLPDINPANLVIVLWSAEQGFFGYNYYEVPGLARVVVGDNKSTALRQARQADAPELARLQNGDVVEFIDRQGEQFRVQTFRGLEGWVYDDWVMPLFGVAAEE